jgi:hypothetical protein
MNKTSLKLAAIFALAIPAFAAENPASGPTPTVVYVGGNDLVLKASDGTLLNYTVPDSYRFSSGGKQLPLSGLKPGTKLDKPVEPGAKPAVISSVSVVKGKVYAVNPPSSITLVTSEGNKDFNVPAGTTFTVGGKPTTVAGLKPDMMVDATVVTPAAEGASITPPATPPMSGALLVAKSEAEAEVPLAGTNLPLIGLVGFAILALGFALRTCARPTRQL